MKKTYLSSPSTIIALLLLALLLYAAVPRAREAVSHVAHLLGTGDTQQAVFAFRDYLLGFGVWAPVVSAALMVFQAVIAPLPAFVITFANGLLFGWAWGALLSWSSAMAGAAVCFWVARALGRPAVERLAGGTRSLEVSDLFFARHGTRAVLISRLLPFISFDIISYGAGLTSIGCWEFLAATGIGQLPATVIYAYLGQNLTGSVKVVFLVFMTTAAILVLGWTFGPLIEQRLRRGAKDGAAPPLVAPPQSGEIV